MSNEYEKLESSLKTAETLKEMRLNPIVEAFVSCVKPFFPGIGELVDSSVNEIVENFQKAKRREFCEYIFDTEEVITKEKISDIEFLMEFGRTLDAINRLAQNEKVIYIAALFKNTFIIKNSYDTDQYEEWLKCIDDLSYRQIEILKCLYDEELKYYGEKYDSAQEILLLAVGRCLVDEFHELVEFRRNDNLGAAVALLSNSSIIGCQWVIFTTATGSQTLRIYAIIVLQSLYH